MEFDLELLPLFFADPKDYIIVNRKPSKQYIDSLKRLKVNIPSFSLETEITNNSEFINLKKNQLKPWGWSPAEHKFLSQLKGNCSDNFKNSPVYKWLPQHRNLYSKKFATSILQTLLEDFPNEHFIPLNQLTEVCSTKSEFELLLKRWGQLMIKAPWSSSGRGLQTIRRTPVHPKVWEKIMAIVKDQGYAIVEPYLNKVLDLAYQFEIKKGKVEYLGISNFSTDYKGQYNGNSLNGLPVHLEKNLIDFVNLMPEIIIPAAIKVIEKSDLAIYYEGIFGLDTLIYLNDKNELKINPCLEINVRQNMGLLSIYLEKLIHPEKRGLYKTYYKPGTSFYHFSEEMKNKNPLKITNSKIESGFFPLIDMDEDTRFGAYLLV